MEPMKVMRGSAYRRRMQERKKKRRRLLLATVLAAVVLVVCLVVLTRNHAAEPENSDAAPFAEAQVDTRELKTGEKTDVSVKVGDLFMIALPEAIDVREVSFTSDNSSVARVDSAGRVDALTPGTAKIIATAPLFNAICECTVTPAQTESERDPDALLTTAITANEDVAARNFDDITRYPFRITVNRRTNTVTVYTYDNKGDYTVPVRAMVCSCGKGGDSSTPTGEFEIYYRDEWLDLSGNVYGLYISGFYEDFLFHSVPYYTMNHGDLKVEEFNKLGSNASEGCVRLMISDVKWIYDNCIVGTPVEVIDADESADPLGKPATVTLDGTRHWDPTDPDPANPYRGAEPAISGAEDVTLSLGGNFNPMQGVKATDTCGNDITDQVTVAGTVIPDKVGVYYLTYTVTDVFNRTCTVDTVVVVNQS